jgi:hypothetical protein
MPSLALIESDGTQKVRIHFRVFNQKKLFVCKIIIEIKISTFSKNILLFSISLIGSLSMKKVLNFCFNRKTIIFVSFLQKICKI